MSDSPPDFKALADVYLEEPQPYLPQGGEGWVKATHRCLSEFGERMYRLGQSSQPQPASDKEMVEAVDAVFKDWLRPSAIRLHAGEMTAQEMRTARAVLGGVHAAVLQAIRRSPAPAGDALKIIKKHRRHVEQSPGVGIEAQRYALAVCDDILADLNSPPAPGSKG